MSRPIETVSFDILGTSVRLGVGVVKDVGPCLKSVGAKKVFIVTDPGVINAGLLDLPQRSLTGQDILYEIFDRIEPNPSDRTVMEGAGRFKETGCNAFLAVGGGSSLDAAKAIQVMVSHPGKIDEYFGPEMAAKITRPKPYLIAVPTTSGTGSEVSRGAVITNTKTKTKAVMRTGPSQLAVIDPEMTLSMPPQLTASTGIDALSHHIEACVSNRYHPVCTALALEGVRLIGNSLKKAVDTGHDLEARMDMAVASMTGALAFQKGLGAVHSLAHQLSSEADVPHGVANAIMLPHGMWFNLSHAQDELALIARALGENTKSFSLSEAAEDACSAVARLVKEVGLPQRLRDVGVKEQQIPVMAEKAMRDWCHPFNPRPCTLSDMLGLYKAAY